MPGHLVPVTDSRWYHLRYHRIVSNSANLIAQIRRNPLSIDHDQHGTSHVVFRHSRRGGRVIKMKIDKDLINSYPFTIRPLTETEGGGFAIEYPDLPGCISDGSTPQEAFKQGCDAVRSFLLSCIKHGDPVPKPRQSKA